VTWLTGPEPSALDLSGRLLARLSAGPILVLPGAYDGLTALLARDAGFEALYLSGAAYTASRGLPDLGLTTSSELADRVRDLVRAAALPVLVDVDTGFGGALNTARTAREMAEAKAAAIQIEDQVMPKKCGHLAGKALVTTAEMVEKIRAAKQAAPDLVVVARTDARAVEGMDAALARAAAYAAAGADAVFPEALTGEDEFRRFAAAVRVPLLANMTEFGVTPQTPARQFEAWGYRMVIYPVSALRLAARAVARGYAQLRDASSLAAFLPEMQTRAELYRILDYAAYEAMDRSLAVRPAGLAGLDPAAPPASPDG
jgi:methylisocitrate lyase